MARLSLIITLILISGCSLTAEIIGPTPAIVPIPSVTPDKSLWTDELAVMRGICFEAALDAVGKVFIMRSAEEHIRFYDLADNSQLCRRAVKRYPFDFTQGAVLAGLWSHGWGCKARHDVLDYKRDDRAKTITLRLKFVTEGDCPYELVRPFWAGFPNARDYAIDITVE